MEEKALLLRRISLSFLVAVAVTPSCALVRAVPAHLAPPPAVTTVLPANTPGLVLVNATPAAWSEVDRFNPLPEALKVPFKVPFLPTAIDFTQDIQPWLGDEVAFALVPTAGSIESSVLQTLDARAVLLAPIKDRDRFDAFLSKLKATRGKPEVEREYKGITILQWAAPAEEKPSKPAAPDSTTRRIQPSPTGRSQIAQSHSSFLPWMTTSVSQSKVVKPTPLPNAPLPEPSEPAEEEPSVLDPSEMFKPRGLAIALLPGNVAIAAQAQTLEDLIDTRSENRSLAQNPLFQRTLQQPQTGRSLLIGYGDVAKIAKFILTIIKTSPPSLAPFGVPSLTENQVGALAKLYNTADTHIWLQPEGIRSQSSFYYTTPQPAKATILTPNANQLLARLPATTYLSANSRNFKRQWQTAIDSTQDDLTNQLAIASLRNSFRSVTGLDPEKDVIPWMDGEYALFFFPTTGGLFNYFDDKLNLGVGLMIQTSDRPAAETALKKLDQFVKTQAKGEVAIVPRRIKGQSIVSWEGKERGKAISVLSHGWVDDKTLLLTTGAAPMAMLNPKPYLPLDRNYTFQTATASFPMPNEGYYYVNMGATLSFLYSIILPSVPEAYSPFVQETQRIVGSVRSISTSNSTTAEAERMDALWVLAPVKKLNPVKQAE